MQQASQQDHAGVLDAGPAKGAGRPLRLLVTAYDYRPGLGGIATCGYELSRALAAEPGVQVRLLAPRCEGDEAFDRHGFFETRRRALPPVAGKAVLPFARWIREESRSWPPDALIELLWLPGGVGCLVNRAFFPGSMPPYFQVAHGVEVMESRRNLRKRVRALISPIKRQVFRRSACAFPVSRFTAQLLEREVRLPAGQLEVVYNGVDIEAFTPGPPPRDLVEAYRTEGRKVFLTVTRLEDYKGVDRALGALRMVVDDHPEALYIVGGTGPDRARLEGLAGSLGLQDHVIFAGRIPTDRLVDHYRLSDCFVMLSRDDYVTPNVEGFGLVFLEAAACGRPSIAGHSGGIPDAVAGGETAWLVDPEDEQAIARAMREALADPDLLSRLGRNARLRAERGFTWGHMARRVLARVRSHVRH